MKYFLVLVAVVTLLITPAFASAAEGADPVQVTVIEAYDPVSVPDLEAEFGSRSAFIEALEGIFGEYQPRTYLVTTYLSDGTAVTSTEVVPGLAGLDWLWISAVALFAMFVFCLMKLIGGAVK